MDDTQKLRHRSSQLGIGEAAMASRQLQFAEMELDPKCMLTLAQKASMLEVEIDTLREWRRDPVFIMRMNHLLGDIRARVKGRIQRKLLQLAEKGSFKHVQLFYKLEGDLIDRVDLKTSHGDMPTDPAEIDKQIEELTTLMPAGRGKRSK